MRIAHLLGARQIENPDAVGLGGVRRAALEISRAQARLGHEVWVVTLGTRRSAVLWQDVRLLTLPIAPWARLSLRRLPLDFSLHLPYVLFTRQHHLDVVHGHEYAYMRFLRANRRLVHFHSDPYWPGGFGEGFDLDPADFASVLRHSHAQIAVSRFIAGQLERGFEGRGNVHVVYNGVDWDRFDDARHRLEGRRARVRWGIPSDDVVFLFSGVLAPEKGAINLAQAFVRLAGVKQGVQLVLAGSSQMLEQGGIDSTYERRLREILVPLEQQGRVHYLGTVPAVAMPMTYAASDVVVIPSVCQEGFSLVAVEALAMGRPVIASASGGLLETVTTRVGFRVQPGNERELEAAMLLLAENPEVRTHLGLAGQRHACRFSWDEAARRLDAIIAGDRKPMAAAGAGS